MGSPVVPLENGKHLYFIYTRDGIMLKVVHFSFVMIFDVQVVALLLGVAMMVLITQFE